MNNFDQTLRALLEDPNIPEPIFERAFDFLAQNQLQNGLADVYSLELASQVLGRFGLCGPKISSRASFRVARLISISAFFRDYCSPPSGFTYLPDTDKFNFAVSDPDRLASWIDPVALTRRNHPCWVTSATALHQITPAEIISGLGIFGDWVPMHALLLEYEIEGSLLHVPTVLDACFQPSFIAKPRGTDDPRTWSWYTNSWGLPEYLHAPTVKLRNPKITPFLFGPAVRKQLPLRLYSDSDNLTFAIGTLRDEQLEAILGQILRQLAAHLELKTLISGEHDILMLTHREFESFMAALYARKGFSTQVTKATRDGGFDVIAFSDVTRERGILIQAKHTSGTVGIRVIRELVGARFFCSEEFSNYLLMVATTGKFSRDARRAENLFPTHISLLDYGQLRQELDRINTQGISDITENATLLRRRILGT